jgi:alginate O-acetyltransferase complex protein AlgI
MVFSSTLFLLYFLPLFVLIYIVTPKKSRNIIALIFSVIFYTWGAPKFIFVLLASSTIDHFIGHAIWNSFEEKRRKLLLAAGLIVNVGLLAYFKYANFFLSNVSDILTDLGIGRLRWVEVILPIGISFFTFQKISYLVDVYRRENQPFKRITDYYLFVILFPQLIAGPIVRFKEIADQIRDRAKSDNIYNRFAGLYRFIIGLAKKVLIANVLGEYADQVFSMNYDLNSGIAWTGLMAYTFQIYFDFAGYSDMAIGLGQMMGFRFPENFNFPYVARSITEFWRRWHITLSSWMRDYLYIPLGGNRVSEGRLYFNLWAVFLISGLWHGANWTFVIWGGYHGLFLVLERRFTGKWLNAMPKPLSILITFIIASTGWAFFRSEEVSGAWEIITSAYSFNDFSTGVIPQDSKFWTAMVIALFFSFIGAMKWSEKLVQFYTQIQYKTSAILFQLVSGILLLIICVGEIASSGFNPFIYFRF